MLKGKTAVVTGGSRGIGKAICLKFAENGADIAFLYAGNTVKAEETLKELEKNDWLELKSGKLLVID